jgi:hypothetical protein
MFSRLMLAFFTLSLALAALPVAAPAAGMPSCRAGDPVVWVNTKSHVYHLKGDQYYGKTKAGDYECESKAKASGARASGSGAAKTSSTSKKTTSTAATKAMPSPSPSPASKSTKKKKKSHTPAATPSP